MNKNIKYLIEKLFDDESELFNDELTLDELNIAENISDYVDLGLTSGTLWCKCNVGAKNPEDFGDYFSFDDANKKYHNSLPSKKLFKDLKYECEWEWCLLNGVNGYKVTGRNGNSIFLPAGGYIDNSLLHESGSQGCYQSSSINTGNTNLSYFLEFLNGAVDPQYYWNRKYICPLRLVKNKG